jgi:hypothetical protein
MFVIEKRNTTSTFVAVLCWVLSCFQNSPAADSYEGLAGGRHVEFSPEVDVERRHRSPSEANDGNGNGSDSSSGRLQRRDTPHHLKNKRVNAATSQQSAAAAAHQLPVDMSSSGSDVRSPVEYPGCRTDRKTDDGGVDDEKLTAICRQNGQNDVDINVGFVTGDVSGVGDDGRMKRILGRPGDNRAYCESFESWASEIPEPVAVSMKMDHLFREEIARKY